MSEKNNSSNNNIKQKNLEQEYNKIIEGLKQITKDFDSKRRIAVIDLIQNLRNQGFEKAVISERLKNDLVRSNLISLSLFQKLLKEQFMSKEELLAQTEEQEQKQKIAVAAGTNIQELEPDNPNETVIEKRERLKEEQLNKSIKKGSGQMPKLKPLLQDQTSSSDDEDETDDSIENDESNDIVGGYQLQESNNITIDDEQHLSEIAKLLKDGKSIVVVIDKNLIAISIKAGKPLNSA